MFSNNMHDTFSSTNQVFYSVSWDLVIWNRKMLDTRHFLIHHEISFLTTHKFWGWTKEIDILHLWNNKNKNSFIFSLCFYISCFSYLHSLSFFLFSNTLIWNANMQNKSHTSSSELNKKVNCMLTERQWDCIMYVYILTYNYNLHNSR